MRGLTLTLWLAITVPATVMAQAPSLADILALIEGGRLEQAERALVDRIEQTDGSEERDLLGVVLSRQGRLDEAEQHFTRAAELDPASASALQHLGRLYLLQDRRPEALEVLRRAGSIGELERDLAFAVANLEISDGDPAAAEVQLRSLVDRFESVKALLLLARLQADRSDLGATMEALQRALDLAPNSETVLSTYARWALEAGAPVAAIVALDDLTRMHPTVPRYFYLAGIARLQARDVSGAVDALRTARALEPQRVSTLVALGLALNTQKQYEESAQLLRDSLRLDPDNVDATAGLAEAEEGSANLESAERYARRALSADPEHPVANLTLGMVRMKQGQYAEARDALERALAVDPESPKTHYQLSLAYARLKDPVRSRRHRELYQQALEAYEEGLRELSEQTGRAFGGMSAGGVGP